jgi:hypothetical protein
VLDLLGQESAGDWGKYYPETCVIVDCKKGQQGRLALTLSDPRILSKSIEFFFRYHTILSTQHLFNFFFFSITAKRKKRNK